MSVTARHRSVVSKSATRSRDKTKAGAHYLARRVVTFLRENEEGHYIRLQNLYGNKKLAEKYGLDPKLRYYGCLVWDPPRIVVDFRNPLATIVHEVLHALYPDATEKEILYKESLVMRHLTEYRAVQIWTLSGTLMRVSEER